MSVEALRDEIDRAVEAGLSGPPLDDLVARLLEALESGAVRAAEPSPGGWRVNAWVKRGILLAFRTEAFATWETPPLAFRDRAALAPQVERIVRGAIRVVPGGTAIRRGAFLADGVVVMPPSYVNVGAHVGPGSLIDSHVLVGSCAQIGARVHLSTAAQIGGVIEPVGAHPVVVEDDAFLGGGVGVYEGARIGAGAVLAPGVAITRAIPLVDLVHGRTIVAGADGVLAVPERAVVVPGSRPAGGRYAAERGIALYAPVIVKYRDAKSDAATVLEEALR